MSHPARTQRLFIQRYNMRIWTTTTELVFILSRYSWAFSERDRGGRGNCTLATPNTIVASVLRGCLTCWEPLYSQVGEDDVSLIEDGRPALVVHVPIHEGVGSHEVQNAVRQLSEWKGRSSSGLPVHIQPSHAYKDATITVAVHDSMHRTCSQITYAFMDHTVTKGRSIHLINISGTVCNKNKKYAKNK